MGYDLHITRRPEWADDDGPEITLEEWTAYVNSDEDVRPDADNGPTDFLWTAHPEEPWPLWWDRGEIYTKNPDEFTIRKLAEIAERLSAKVQGDDGEVYGVDGAAPEPESATSPPAARLTFLSRIGSWFRRRPDVRELQQGAPAFFVGQRVKNPRGELGTVLEADRNANGGLGNVRVRFDDGREHHLAYVASGLEIVGDAPGGGGGPLRVASLNLNGERLIRLPLADSKANYLYGFWQWVELLANNDYRGALEALHWSRGTSWTPELLKHRITTFFGGDDPWSVVVPNDRLIGVVNDTAEFEPRNAEGRGWFMAQIPLTTEPADPKNDEIPLMGLASSFFVCEHQGRYVMEHEIFHV